MYSRMERNDMERSVEIPVSKKLRNELRQMKREKTYENFLIELINQKKGNTSTKSHRGESNSQ